MAITVLKKYKVCHFKEKNENRKKKLEKKKGKKEKENHLQLALANKGSHGPTATIKGGQILTELRRGAAPIHRCTHPEREIRGKSSPGPQPPLNTH